MWFLYITCIALAATIIWSRYGMLTSKVPTIPIYLILDKVIDFSVLHVVLVCAILLGMGATYVACGAQATPWFLFWPIALCGLVSKDFAMVAWWGIISGLVGLVMANFHVTFGSTLAGLGLLLLVASVLGACGEGIWSFFTRQRHVKTAS